MIFHEKETEKNCFSGQTWNWPDSNHLISVLRLPYGCRWKDYSSLARINELPLSKQLSIFRSCLSPEMHENLVYALNIKDDDVSMSTDEILTAIKEYIREKRNLTLDRFVLFPLLTRGKMGSYLNSTHNLYFFFEGWTQHYNGNLVCTLKWMCPKFPFDSFRYDLQCRKQQENESFDHFVVALKSLAEEAELCQRCADTQVWSIAHFNFFHNFRSDAGFLFGLTIKMELQKKTPANFSKNSNKYVTKLKNLPMETQFLLHLCNDHPADTDNHFDNQWHQEQWSPEEASGPQNVPHTSRGYQHLQNWRSGLQGRCK